jgi:maltooligosyltrehalose trehalohydrolase
LDVVYNHLGPEGNYFNDYGPYFTEKYRTPWGSAINYDGPGSDNVRGFFINNALYWMETFHIDMLRLDAVHGIFDFGARHFLAELQDSVNALAKRLGRKLFLIAESDLNDSRLLRSPCEGGYGLPAQWSDDFHHSLHTLLTGERSGYYEDFGEIRHLAETMRKGWLYAGQYSQHRRRKHGNSASGLARSSFVVCIQNHDQVGNRARGDRLAELVDFESQKIAAGVTLLAPFIPLIFMGEEYGDTAPFQYFTSHGDPNLIEVVRKGRRAEFAAFGWQGEVPDPDDEATFERSKLRHELKEREPHRTLRELYQELVQIRRKYDLAGSDRVEVLEGKDTITMIAEHDGTVLAAIFAFANQKTERSAKLPEGTWKLRLDSGDARWRGGGSRAPKEIRGGDSVTLARPSFALYERVAETS